MNISQAQINPIAKKAVSSINNATNKTYNNFQPTVNLNGSGGNNPSDDRRKQEQLMRKLGAIYGAK